MELVDHASQVLSHWPDGYHALLNRLGSIYRLTNSSIGFTQQFRAFYLSMFKINSWYCPEASFLQEEFIRFGLVSWNQGIVCDSLVKTLENPPQSRFISLKEYHQRFGISYNTINQMILDGAVILKQAMNKKGRKVVDLEQSLQPLDSKGSMSAQQAARYLGLPFKVLPYLREWGIYRSVTYHSGYKSTWHVVDLEAFLELSLKLFPLIASDETDLVKCKNLTLHQVMGLRRHSALKKAQLVAAMFDGRLPVVGRIGNNLAGLLLNQSAVLDWVLKNDMAGELKSRSQVEAAQLTDLQNGVIGTVIQMGLLEGVMGNGRLRVLSHSIDGFNANYRTNSRLAKTLEVPAKRLRKICDDRKIPVISLAPSTLGCGGQWIIAQEYETALRDLVLEEKTRLSQKLFEQEQYGEGVEKYESRLAAYLRNLREGGGRLPRYAGKLNISAITRALGFSKDPLLKNPSVLKMLKDFESAENIRYGTHSKSVIQALKDYLNRLQENGLSLPRKKNGNIYKAAIAKSCGFHVKTMFYRKEVLVLLEVYEKNQANSLLK